MIDGTTLIPALLTAMTNGEALALGLLLLPLSNSGSV